MRNGAEKLFSFRWDVDHRACITDGLPRIRDICRRLGVVNTFFVNMGRSTNLREWLGKGLARSKAKLGDKEAIHLIAKIGWSRFLLETVLARPVGRSFVKELGALQSEGHELAQHGASDHVVWSRRFPEIPDHVLEADIAATREEFTAHFGPPAGFTSPGFRSDDRLARIIDRLEFRYDGDQIGGVPARTSATGVALDHWRIPVTVCGPRTIPFIEWHGARGTRDDDILTAVGELTRDEHWVVMYGHPCYEGVRADLLERIFRKLGEQGFRFVTHQQMAELLERGKAPP